MSFCGKYVVPACLAYLSIPLPTLFTSLSSQQDRTERGKEILAFIETKAKRDKIPLNVEEWTIEVETNSPQQTNDHDCGVYACTLAYFLSEGKRMDEIVETMDPIFIQHQRQRMLFSLLYPTVGISQPFVD